MDDPRICAEGEPAMTRKGRRGGSLKGAARRSMAQVERMKLTTAKVQALTVASEGKKRYIWDSEIRGFCVCVNPTGIKTYFVRYRSPEGRQRFLSVGEHPKVTAEQARKVAKEKLGAASQGADPAKERDLRRASMTVEEASKRFMEEQITPKVKPRTAREYQRQFDCIILPVIGRLAVPEITPEHIAKIHFGIRDKPTLSNRVHSLLNHFFKMIEVLKLRPFGMNPCLGHKKYSERSRDRFLSDHEMSLLGPVLDEATRDGSEYIPGVMAIRMLLLGGMRRNEVLALRWEEVDEEAGLIRLADSKTGPRTVDITPRMQHLFNEMRGWADREQRLTPYVFPGRFQAGPYTDIYRMWVRILKRAGIMKEDQSEVPVRIHDIRRTYGTVAANDVGAPMVEVRDMMGHSKIETTETYARTRKTSRRGYSEKVSEEIEKKLFPKLG